ncbi:MAG: AbrB family transcriptional regulator [Burkholderiales bacterium]
MNPFAKALLVAAPAGAIFAALHAPLPWTTGPLLACAVANLAGAGMSTPVAARNFGQWMIGTALGLYFTAEVVSKVVAYAPWIVLGVAWSLGLGLGFAWTLRRFGGVSRPTAFYAGAIGGATEMAVQGERAGGRVDQIAAAHSLRLMLVVLALPTIYRLLDLHGADPYQPPARTVHWDGLAMLVAATVAAALAWRRLSWPNAWMLGPLAVTFGLTASGHAWSALPQWLIVAGQVTIGASLGCRFTPSFFAQAPKYVAVVAAMTLGGIVLSAGFASLLSLATGVPLATMVLATSPGGIAEMSLTAKTLQLGVPVVTAFHVVRAVSTMTLLGLVYRLLARRRGWTG